MFVCISKNPDGSHAFQYGGAMQEGWAFLPEKIELPDSFPFIDIEVAEVTHPAVTGVEKRMVEGKIVEETIVVIPEITRMEVISVKEGKRIPTEEPDPVPASAERIAALEEQNAMLTECLLEMSEIVYA